ncbi:hypothetical protein H7F36_18375 [Variovorax sp. PAMC28562]|nr:hypothetical protein [Variovorax sp. PAMC28562]QNK76122.1 hypothetical protein H7F36_18375 [Variovorax sp. PAMC28562]
MATLIPAISSFASRMTGGEKRLAERLERKLEDDYLLWYDVLIGHRHLHPDFVMHPHLDFRLWKQSTIPSRNKFQSLVILMLFARHHDEN